MRISGIVAEYDPFHNGHAYLLERARSSGATHTVCVMSGLFTQRGEPAALSARARSEAALRNGADLVLELPLPWACAGAEVFARGAVCLLAALGNVNMLAFGSELGDTGALLRAARALGAADGSPELRRALDSGAPLPRARALAAEKLCPGAGRLGPNDILAAEYLRALDRFAPYIEPLAVRRSGARHDGPERGGVASAMEIRRRLAGGDVDGALGFVPESAAAIYRREFERGRAPFSNRVWETVVLTKLRCAGREYFAGLPDVGEGLENRLWRAAREAVTLDGFLGAVKTKRYTMSRIRRIACCAALGVTSDLQSGTPPYIRVLALNARGAEILAGASPHLPLVTRRADTLGLDPRGREIYSVCCRAADLWGLCLPERLPCGEEQRFTPTVL